MLPSRHLFTIFAVLLATLAQPAAAQTVAFGGIQADTSAPVEVSADSLAVDQTDGSATFSGNVLVVQGALRLAAAQVRVEYGTEGQSRIERLHASGQVRLVSANEAAEAAEAVYTILSGEIVMTGNVLLTQGANVLSGQRLTVNLTTGLASMEGRVQTTLQPGGN
jgi:lipopolysaccharide export system protein LptA